MADTEKTLKTRILLSYDKAENWENVPNFKPERGEVIVVAEDSELPIRFKIGTGDDSLEDLPTFCPMNHIEDVIDAKINSSIKTALNTSV